MISLIIPCYNEEQNVHELFSRIKSVFRDMNDSYEIIFVDDGSTDNTVNRLAALSEEEDHIKIIELSRNFGHQSALCAGLDYAVGDAVITMDADLQHPPELIPLMIKQWKQGHDIVYTVRTDPPDISFKKKYSAKIYYKLINLLANINIPQNTADFRLLDKRIVQQIKSLKEKTKFLRGLVSWVGFKQYAIHYEAASRHAGRSKYTFLKMIKFALDGITSFSAFPLHIATILGVLVSLLSFIYAVYAVYIRLATHSAVPGWTSVLVAVLFLGGVQLLSLGIIGEYLHRVYEETKSRPTYIVKNVYGAEGSRYDPPGI